MIVVGVVVIVVVVIVVVVVIIVIVIVGKTDACIQIAIRLPNTSKSNWSTTKHTVT